MKTTWNKPPGSHSSFRPRGLLPTPGIGGNRMHLSTPKAPGLLARPPLMQMPVKKKTPLLQTPPPSSRPSTKPALLPSPAKKPFSPAQKPWQRQNPPAKPVGTMPSRYQSSVHHPQTAPRHKLEPQNQSIPKRFEPRKNPTPKKYSSKLDAHNLQKEKPISNQKEHSSKMDAYKLHKEKLAKNAANKPDVTCDTNIYESNQNQAEKNQDKSSDGLTCLASYLLQMKSGLQSPTPSDKLSNSLGASNSLGDAEVPQNMSPKTDKHDITDANLLESNSLSDLSAVNESLDKQLLDEPSLNEDEKTTNELDAQQKQIQSKSKKNKIQLSQYASKNENVESDMSQQKETDIDFSIDVRAPSDDEFFYEKSVESEKSDIAPRTASDYVYVIEDEDIIPTGEISSKTRNDFSDSKTPDERPTMSSTLKLDENDSSTKDTSSSDEQNVKVTEKNELTDLPYIFPVSGYFCDVCCDFFFDQTSTASHCKTAAHAQKVKAAEKKSESSKRKPPSSNGDVSEQYEKKKAKLSNERSSFDRTGLSGHQTNWKQASKFGGKQPRQKFSQQNHEIADSVYVMEHEQPDCESVKQSNKRNQNSGNRGRWKNFVIPKRR